MNSPPRRVDRLTTLSRPSAAQKRFWAKGRPDEMHSTTMFGRLPALLLKVRTEVAQVGVSTLGKMFRILRLPANEDRSTSFRSRPTRLNAGALSPADGNWPPRVTGLPRNVTFVI